MVIRTIRIFNRVVVSHHRLSSGLSVPLEPGASHAQVTQARLITPTVKLLELEVGVWLDMFLQDKPLR
jgi:hypothetical protein